MRVNKRKLKYLLVVILLLTISVGYAVINSTLNISGVGTINNPTWDIHFESIQVKTGSVTPTTAATLDTPRTTINYAVTFTIPGEYYEFTVNAVNAGTIDGMVSVVSNKLNGTEITTLPNYLEYKVSYADDVDIQPNHLLAAGTSETYKVHVGYKKDINISDIPSSIEILNLSFSVTYIQSDTNVVSVPHPRTVYTASSSGQITIGQSIPSSITQYSSAAEANSSYGRRFCLKHIVVNDIVTESYLEFIVTQYDVDNYPGMTVGTYALRGAGATYNSSTNKYNDDSPYYESNKQVLLNAFGSSNCNFIQCIRGSLAIYSEKNGYVNADDTACYCRVLSSGKSFCGCYGPELP